MAPRVASGSVRVSMGSARAGECGRERVLAGQLPPRMVFHTLGIGRPDPSWGRPPGFHSDKWFRVQVWPSDGTRADGDSLPEAAAGGPAVARRGCRHRERWRGLAAAGLAFLPGTPGGQDTRLLETPAHESGAHPVSCALPCPPPPTRATRLGSVLGGWRRDHRAATRGTHTCFHGGV